MKRRLLVLIIATIGLFVFLLMRSYGFISVALEGTAGDHEITYSILDQRSSKATEIKNHSPSFKRLVSRGSYEVMATVDGKSFLAAVNTGGFFGTTKVSAKPVEEKARSFIGNDPGPCMYRVSGVLMSMTCTDTLENLKIHLPATSNSPTFTRKVPSHVAGFVEGIVTTKEGSIALLNSIGSLSSHTAYIFGADGNVTNGTSLADLTAEHYSLAKYKDGFIAYDDHGTDVFYYESLKSKPTKISADASAAGLDLYSVSVAGDDIMLTYTNSGIKEEGSINPEGIEAEAEGATQPPIIGKKKAAPQSEILIYHNKQFKRFSFKSIPSHIRLCGTDKVCFLDENGKLEIYDVSNDKHKHLYDVTGVTYIENIKSGLLVFRKEGVFLFDTEGRSGALNYSLGNDYSFCGIIKEDATYTLCLVDTKGNKVALVIDQAKSNQDSIDKKIAQLLLEPTIKNISVYDKSIFISPELGDLIYDDSLKSFTYDPVVKKSVNDSINNRLAELGINKNTYKVVNTAE